MDASRVASGAQVSHEGFTRSNRETGINLALLTVFTGIAVVAFRAFIIFGMRAGTRKWWAGRQARKLQMTPDAERGEI